jgi:hypothetical protein
LDEAVAQAQQLWDRMRDPATPAEDAAAALMDMYAGEPVRPGLAMLLSTHRGSVDEVLKVAAAALTAGDVEQVDEPSLTALTFGAHAAHLAGDHAQARRLMDQAMDGPVLGLRAADHLVIMDRVADALELLSTQVAGEDYDSEAAEVHQSALEAAHRRLAGAAPTGDCSCGRGLAWSECCREREATEVARFSDQSSLDALRAGVAEFVRTSEWGEVVAAHVADWLDEVEAESWEPNESESLETMATEHAWLVAGADEDSDDDDDEDDDVFVEFLLDGDAPPPVARAALAWHRHVRYGLWQVADPTTAPGLRCVELLTGDTRYVSFAPEQIEGLPRWSVLLGAVVPIDGAWRSTGTFIRVSPREADALYETVQAAFEVVLGDIVDSPSKQTVMRARQPTPFRDAPPNNVYAYLEEPVTGPAANLLSQVTGASLTRLLGELYAARATPPRLTNTDGDEMCEIKAHIQVRDGAEVVARLTQHPDFDADASDEGRLVWLGQAIPAGRRASMLAEARAQLRAAGHSDSDVAAVAGAQRWIRGQIRRRDNVLVVEVNSEERLQRLLTLLDEVGAQPTVADRSRVDPAQDLPWPAAHRPLGGGLAAAEEGWQRHWLDDRVPALGHRTPRKVAATDDWPLVEGLVRQLEYDADLLARTGAQGADTTWLRDQLGLQNDRFD